MKKIICILLLFCFVTICFTSCTSLESCEKNLGKDYEIDIYDEDEIENFVKKFNDDYEISAIMEVKNKDKDKNKEYSTYIIQCGSSKKAEELARIYRMSTGIVNAAYSSDVSVDTDGKFVFFGDEAIINKALNK